MQKKGTKMMYVLILISTLLHVNTTHCWGSSKSTIDGDIKQDVNFSGRLITQQGQEYIVNNISIQGKYKQIVMYDKPVKHAEPILNNETKQLEIKLDNNPSTDLSESKIDLSEVSEINVPSPNTLWFYQKKEGQQKLEFIEVDVITKSNTKRSYLLERKARISCDEIDSAGPQEKRVPLAALDKLIIEGYSAKINVSGDNKKCVQTLICPAKKAPEIKVELSQ
jgi:hypothetical protein